MEVLHRILLLSHQGGNLVAFYSPETTIYQGAITGVSGIQAVTKLTGVYHSTDFLPNGENKSDNYYNALLNYDDIDLVEADPQFIETSTVQYVPQDTGVPTSSFNPTNTNITILTENVNGFLFFKLVNGTLNIENDLLNGRPEFMVYDSPASDTDDFYIFDIDQTGSYARLDPAVYNSTTKEIKGYTTRYLYNLVAPKGNQYGEIYDAKYIVVGSKLDGLNQNSVFYNGDTFIGKVAIKSMAKRRIGTDTSAGFLEKFITTSYFFCESSINVNYRHYIAPVGGNTLGTIPYYPKYKIFNKYDGTGMNELPATYGHSTGYNKQYSFENSLRQFFPMQLAQKSVTEYPNRTIYSGQSIEGEQFDANRLYLTNNYYILLSHYGKHLLTKLLHNLHQRVK